MYLSCILAMLFLYAPSGSDQHVESRVAEIKRVEIVGAVDDTEFRVVVHASGYPHAESIKKIEFWVDGLKTPVPEDVYVNAWNVNPATAEILSESGLQHHRLPPDAWRPIMSLGLRGYANDVGIVIFYEKLVPVASLFRTFDGLECLAFDERYQVLCDSFQKYQESPTSDDGEDPDN